MMLHNDLTQQAVYHFIKNGSITLAGNSRLKIYGLLNCYSGKRMKRINRVFFRDEAEAKELGFRSCKNCIRRQTLWIRRQTP